MTQETQQEQTVLTLELTLDQVNFVFGALGKLPTESGAWMIRQIIANQIQPQLPEKTETTEEQTVQ